MGYPFVWLTIILTSLGLILYFKRKGWW